MFVLSTGGQRSQKFHFHEEFIAKTSVEEGVQKPTVLMWPPVASLWRRCIAGTGFSHHFIHSWFREMARYRAISVKAQSRVTRGNCIHCAQHSFEYKRSAWICRDHQGCSGKDRAWFFIQLWKWPVRHYRDPKMNPCYKAWEDKNLCYIKTFCFTLQQAV